MDCDLIDRQALDNAFTSLRFKSDGELAHWGDRKDWCLHGSEIEKLIDDAPTIDAVPVVRCGECKHCYAEGFVHEHNVCEKHPELNDIPDGWYCADGERMDGERREGE